MSLAKLLRAPCETRETLGIEALDLHVPTQAEFAEGALSGMYRPDDWNAFVTYKVNHSLPVVAGPLASGNYTAYHPLTIQRSYKSLLWKQNNMNHKLRSLDASNRQPDSICGCVIGVQFPPGNWNAIPATPEEAPAMTVVATVFKQAQGVSKMIGEHLSSKRKWSVSLETVFDIMEAAIWLPKSRRIVPMEQVAEDAEMLKGITRRPGGFLFGRVGGTPEGEQPPARRPSRGASRSPWAAR
jgi:hypothetical protein